MFGILYSTVVTPLFLPAVPALMFGLRQRRLERRAAGEATGQAAG